MVDDHYSTAQVLAGTFCSLARGREASGNESWIARLRQLVGDRTRLSEAPGDFHTAHGYLDVLTYAATMYRAAITA